MSGATEARIAAAVLRRFGAHVGRKPFRLG